MQKTLGRLYIAVGVIGILIVLYFAYRHYTGTVTVIGTVERIQANRLITGEKVTLVEIWGRDGRYYTLGLEGDDNDFMKYPKLLSFFMGEVEVTFQQRGIVARDQWPQELLDKCKRSNPIDWLRIKSYRIVSETP